jgi:predicted DNA binding CopG/RHH family protein
VLSCGSRGVPGPRRSLPAHGRTCAPKELLGSVERGEWKSAGSGKRERTRYARYAKATFRKDRRLNIRLSSKDLEAIQKRAIAEGLPYQTLISSPLHKYASGRLKEV